MAQNKTTENDLSVDAYMNAIADEKRRNDVAQLLDLFTELTGISPRMWGTAILGWGSYHYRYDSGHEGDAPIIGLSSRANAITLYLESAFEGRDELLAKIGKHKSSKACLYIKKLSDIDLVVLKEIVIRSVKHTENSENSRC